MLYYYLLLEELSVTIVWAGAATFAGVSQMRTNNDGEFLRADADSIDGTWLDQDGGSSLFNAIKEGIANDADFIHSAKAPASDICKISFGDPVATPLEPMEVYYRYKRRGDKSIDLTVRLLQGGTQIASWTTTGISDTYTDAVQALTSPQFASISDFTNLFLEFTANQP